MKNGKPFERHLKSASDLVTTPEARRAGFVSFLLERNKLANPLIERARALQTKIQDTGAPKDLLSLEEIRSALLAAAGISDKALKHLSDEDKEAAILALVEKVLVPAGEKFQEELIYRYLLTKGDALGGSMRNIIGTLGVRKVARAMVANLAVSETKFSCLYGKSNWIAEPDKDDPDLVNDLNAITYEVKGQPRTIKFGLKVPAVGKNVDVCLLSCHGTALSLSIDTASHYLALGEIKGGIDPAGADEHWKTADTALSRIRSRFTEFRLNPPLFFVGGAIADGMSLEIWKQLGANQLINAANLNHETQLYSLVDWLVTL